MDIICIIIINMISSKINYIYRGSYSIENSYVTINSEDSVGKAIWTGYIKLIDFHIKLKKVYL